MDFSAAGRALLAFAVIALVLAGLHLGTRLLRRPWRNGRALIRIAETHYLPGGASLHVVEVGARRYLVGRGAQLALIEESGDGRPADRDPRAISELLGDDAGRERHERATSAP